MCRHGLVRRNGVVDLQKGERYVVRPSPHGCILTFFRYANMDLPFICTLLGVKVKMIKLSYDIVCRWYINLFRRIGTYSPELQIPEDRFFLEWFIPKFHLPAHGSPCHTKFSFNYRPGVGRTHGENIESGWAHTNPAAVATREMGPGARHSTLDSHWGGWNWRKVTGFGEWHSNRPMSYHKPSPPGVLLLKNLHEARQMVQQCEETCQDFESRADPGTLMEWRAMKRSWERDPSKPDPFKLVEKRGSYSCILSGRC